MGEYSCDYHVYTKKIYIISSKVKSLKFICCVAMLYFCVGMKIWVRCAYLVMRGQVGKLSGIFLLGRGCIGFKTRHRNHIASFRHAKHKNSTELSKHIWTLKNDNIDYSISWRVLSSSSPYNSSSKRCNLCLKEKFLIICRPDLSSLNKRNELVSSCRHRNKALLRNSWTLNF